MYGPDVTFAGVGRCDLDDPASLEGVDVVIIGAPYDAGASYRSGARFGPKMIRTTDYLPHDGRRPHLALDVDPLVELGVVDVGDVEMPPGDMERSLRALESAVATIAGAGKIRPDDRTEVRGEIQEIENLPGEARRLVRADGHGHAQSRSSGEVGRRRGHATQRSVDCT